MNIGNGRNDETIGSFRMEVLSERLNINRVLLCRWMLWLHVRLMNRSIVVLCCVSRMLELSFMDVVKMMLCRGIVCSYPYCCCYSYLCCCLVSIVMVRVRVANSSSGN